MSLPHLLNRRAMGSLSMEGWVASSRSENRAALGVLKLVKVLRTFPLNLSFSQTPSWITLPSSSNCLPSPSRSFAFHYPSYFVPSLYKYTPSPCRWSSLNIPKKVSTAVGSWGSGFKIFSVPLPFFFPSAHDPSYSLSFCSNLPFPCLFPSFHSPT